MALQATLAANSTGKPKIDPKQACEPCWTRDRRISQAVGSFLGERMCEPCRRAEGIDADDDRFEWFQVSEVRPCASANGKGGAVTKDEDTAEQPTPPVAKLRGDVAPPEQVAKDTAVSVPHDWEGFAEEIDRYGLWKRDIAIIAEAGEKALKLPFGEHIPKLAIPEAGPVTSAAEIVKALDGTTLKVGDTTATIRAGGPAN